MAFSSQTRWLLGFFENFKCYKRFFVFAKSNFKWLIDTSSFEFGKMWP